MFPQVILKEIHAVLSDCRMDHFADVSMIDQLHMMYKMLVVFHITEPRHTSLKTFPSLELRILIWRLQRNPESPLSRIVHFTIFTWSA